MSRKMRKDIVGWYLYDFANSFLIINGSLYFPQWIIGPTNTESDFWYNFAFVASSVVPFLLLLFSDISPIKLGCTRSRLFGRQQCSASPGLESLLRR